ncbi:MAG: SDR family NAD(P)-dependent oxidoreductase [Gammaproteobacteria bacterium]|nr:SDR family NAD(P)-dependent oxidoreductase [Gammaproteobacteria bacterium]
MNKTILITGASSGFGEAGAKRFAEPGVTQILVARSIDKLTELEKRIKSKCKVIIAQVDVTDSESVKGFFEEYQKQIEKVDVLINSAGLALGLALANETDIDDWENMVDTNVKGLMRMTRNVLPYMVKRNSGHIINIGSIAGSWPYPGGNVYGATKSFVQQFSRGLRADLLGKNIHVTYIEPGMSKTNFSVVRFKGDSKRANEVYEKTRPILPEDIAEILYWIASLPSHININSMEVMPICQAWGALPVDRNMD